MSALGIINHSILENSSKSYLKLLWKIFVAKAWE